jgi:drug/metabolite transporter (DMT)-like permease
MNVVAPLSGVLAAALPALVGLALGERPAPTALVGLGLALPAVWLTARTEHEDAGRSGTRESVMDGVLAGLGFAVLFIGLQRAGRGEGLWPTASSQIVAALPMLALHARALRRAPDEPPEDGWIRLGPLVAGVLVSAAAICFFLATQRGLLTVVAVLTSLYPAVTVALARWLLAERIGRWQGVGLALAAVSVALISGG